MKSPRGFTLIELLVVISIVALLSSIVLAALNTARDKGRLAAGMNFSSSLYHAAGSEALAIFPLEEGSGSTAGDTTGNGYTGTITGATWQTNTYGTASKYSLNFSGASYVTGGVLSSANYAPNMSYSVWIKPTVAYAKTILSARAACSTANFQLHMDSSGRIVWYGSTAYAPGYVVPLNTWTHIAATVNSSNLVSFYANGAFIGSATVGARDTTSANIRIGVDGTCGNYFSGNIDDVRIYNTNLSLSMIKDIYAQGALRHLVER